MNQTTQRSLATALALLFLALPAFGAGEGGDGNIFTGDLGNMIWTLVVFGLVVFVLGKFAWGPILDGLQKREDFIHDSLEKARQDRDAAEARLKEYEARLNDARAEATSIVEEGRRDAEVLRGRIEQEAREEADKALARAKREIDIARETAVKELYVLSGNLATDLAGRIVGRELKAEDHERLIGDAISDLTESEAN
ncbi:MAG: F0F1 ATP synthase subunit B [Acidobacteriota bacterium]